MLKRTKKGNKTQDTWLGPYKVVTISKYGSCQLRCMELETSQILQRKVNVSQLKLYRQLSRQEERLHLDDVQPMINEQRCSEEEEEDHPGEEDTQTCSEERERQTCSREGEQTPPDKEEECTLQWRGRGRLTTGSGLNLMVRKRDGALMNLTLETLCGTR